MVAAVLAIVIALVPDPVTVARAPSAYVPLDPARFTPVGELDLLPDARSGVHNLDRADRLGAPEADSIPDTPGLDAPIDGLAPEVLLGDVVPPLDLGSSGHVGQLVSQWRTTVVSWYGPGFYGNRTACGYALTQSLVGVAHRSLPCGTLVQFRWGGRTVSARVVDRGPYVYGRLWDLTAGLCALLNHCYTGPITWKIP